MGFNIFACVAIGSIFTGCALSIAGYFITINSTDGGWLGPESDWWPIMVVINLIAGLIVGGISAAIIVGFNLNFVKAVSLCGILNLLIVIGFYVFTNGLMSESIRYSLYALIPIGLINGGIVSWFFSTPQVLK